MIALADKKRMLEIGGGQTTEQKEIQKLFGLKLPIVVSTDTAPSLLRDAPVWSHLALATPVFSSVHPYSDWNKARTEKKKKILTVLCLNKYAKLTCDMK